MVITDRYDHVIDDKNRLAIPSPIRNAMDPEKDGTAFYVFPENGYLQLIPEKLFQKLAAEITGGIALPAEVAKARRLVFGMASRIEWDKQGRVIIPDRFLRDAKNVDPFVRGTLEREVTLVGANDRLELWNRSEFMAHMTGLVPDASSPSLQSAMEFVFGKAPGMSPN
jgi:MraZ protein